MIDAEQQAEMTAKEMPAKEMSAKEIAAKETEEVSSEILDEPEEFPNKYYKVFHQPDPDIPKRFMPLTSSTEKLNISVDGFMYTIRSDEGGVYEGINTENILNYLNGKSITILQD